MNDQPTSETDQPKRVVTTKQSLGCMAIFFVVVIAVTSVLTEVIKRIYS